MLFVNAEGREVFGVEAGTRGGPASQQIWAEPGQRARSARRIAGAWIEQLEVRMRRHDGSEFDAIMSARPLHYGGERAVLGVITDITERRRIEEALRESEARLQALMDHAPLVVHLKDRDGRYLLANPEVRQHLRPRARRGDRPDAVRDLPADEAEIIDRHHREVLETGRSRVPRGVPAEPRRLPMEHRRPLPDPGREGPGRGRRRLRARHHASASGAEEALKASEARLAAFMEHAPARHST